MKKNKSIYLAPGVPQVLNYQCTKCGSKFGTNPGHCHWCNGAMKQIKPCNS